MKLDATDLRYISSQEFRVLTAVEMGSKNHEVVPSSLAAQISGLHHSGINKLLGSLAKRNLIARVQNTAYDGYRLTYGGYDFLALRAFSQRDSVAAVGRRIGVGKESDIMLVSSPDQQQRVLKIHRLGRISFRAIKEKRDYMGKRKSASWMYMSRLAAAKEYAFMKILHEHGFPVPEPIDQARHCIVMSYIDAFPLRQIAVLPAEQIPLLYSALMKLIVRLAKSGLIHGDFNEFNLLIREVKNSDDDEYDSDVPQQTAETKDPRGRAANPIVKQYSEDCDIDRDASEVPLSEGQRIERGNGFERVVAVSSEGTNRIDGDAEQAEAEEDSSSDDGEEEEEDGDSGEQVHLDEGVTVEPILIDFPQMVSINHENAEYYFDRDVECVRRFFRKRFRFQSEEYPRFVDVVPEHARKKTKATKAAVGEERQADGAASSALNGEDVRLDLLARASGFSGSKQDRELEQYMSSLRLSTTEGMIEAADTGDDASDGSEDASENSSEDEDAATDDDDEAEALEGSKSNKERSESRDAPKPSRGAARKAALDGDDSKIAQLVATDRARAARKAEKHHGRKAHSGKGGRTHAGGKSKTGKARIINDSLNF
ncbi:hypothetical protein BCV70DRAFT_203156 [Testicularia cyperi]|uniref:Serine/threonine-protein kinase RIO2 n=1 Tax=Testicularia cyperi TaxID=1882483 RepID=A0A317XFA5_9BASI|nr:hypothetical protein BCV70DRAFT_203156 [Testicularia cyperi]